MLKILRGYSTYSLLKKCFIQHFPLLVLVWQIIRICRRTLTSHVGFACASLSPCEHWTFQHLQLHTEKYMHQPCSLWTPPPISLDFGFSPGKTCLEMPQSDAAPLRYPPAFSVVTLCAKCRSTYALMVWWKTDRRRPCLGRKRSFQPYFCKRCDAAETSAAGQTVSPSVSVFVRSQRAHRPLTRGILSGTDDAASSLNNMFMETEWVRSRGVTQGLAARLRHLNHNGAFKL